MLQEFRDFLNRGSVMDLAVAVVIGAAFGAVITSLVNDILMPLIGILLGGIDFTSLSVQVGNATLTYGNFIQALVNFIIIAFAIFLIVRMYNRSQRKKEEAPPAPPAPSAEVIVLTEIRELLRRQRQ